MRKQKTSILIDFVTTLLHVTALEVSLFRRSVTVPFLQLGKLLAGVQAASSYIFFNNNDDVHKNDHFRRFSTHP